MKKLIKRMLGVVGIFTLLVFLCGAGLFLDVWLYPTFGRINDFQAVKDGTLLAGTNYTLAINDGHVGLQNSITHQTINTYGANQYSLLRHNDGLYFIQVEATSGSGNLLDFSIYNITTDQPRIVTDNNGLSDYASCAYPRLDGDVLEFEQGQHCDFFPLFGGSIRSSRLP